jgi:transposase InsO family protein
VSRFRFIAAEKANSSVVRLCRALGVSTSGFYDWQHHQPSARARTDAVLIDHIREVHATSHCTYGAPRIHADLRATGTLVGKKRVARLMRTAGLAGRCPKRFRRTTIHATTPGAQPPDLVRRDFRPIGPNRVWVADITYVRTWEGWLYLAVILDAFSRRVVGWALADHLRTELAIDALQMALISRRPAPGLIHHSDRGGQYLSAAYIGQLATHGARSSVGWPGTCFDNAAAESFFATLKTELLHRAVWPTRQHARTAIFHYVEGFYNRLRRHSTLNYQSPDAFEADYLAANLAA